MNDWLTICLVVLRIFFYLYGAFEAVRRRNYLIWSAFMFFIVANTLFQFSVAGQWLDLFRTLGAMALVIGYMHKR